MTEDYEKGKGVECLRPHCPDCGRELSGKDSPYDGIFFIPGVMEVSPCNDCGGGKKTKTWYHTIISRKGKTPQRQPHF